MNARLMDYSKNILQFWANIPLMPSLTTEHGLVMLSTLGSLAHDPKTFQEEEDHA